MTDGYINTRRVSLMRDKTKIIANTDISIHDRGNNLIKDMSKLTENILD